MKKKILSSLLALLLIVTILFSLTACRIVFDEEDDEGSSKSSSSKQKDDDEDEEESSNNDSAEEVIEELVEAINDHDVNAIMDLIDLEYFEKYDEFFSEIGGQYSNKHEFNKKIVKNGLKYYFEKHKDFKIKLKDLNCITDDEDYKRVRMNVKSTIGIKNAEFYAANIILPNDAEYDVYSDNEEFIILKEIDGNYKVVLSTLAYLIAIGYYV